jgi:hypothetical protein
MKWLWIIVDAIAIVFAFFYAVVMVDHLTQSEWSSALTAGLWVVFFVGAWFVPALRFYRRSKRAR